jgi:hypothetical protein
LEEIGEVYTGLPKILEAFVKAQDYTKVADFLQRFKNDIKKLEEASNPHISKFLLRFRYFHALYHFKIGTVEKGLDETIEAARLADKLGNTERFKDSLWLYWQYHQYTSASQKAKFEQILRRSEKL